MRGFTNGALVVFGLGGEGEVRGGSWVLGVFWWSR